MTGEIGGVGHATKKTERLIFLPNRETGAVDVEGEVKFRVKVVPTNEPSTGFIVEETEKRND